MVDQLADGMVLKPAVKYQHVAQNMRAARQSLNSTGYAVVVKQRRNDDGRDV